MCRTKRSHTCNICNCSTLYSYQKFPDREPSQFKVNTLTTLPANPARGADDTDSQLDLHNLWLVTCPCCHSSHDLAEPSAPPRRRTHRDDLETALAELGALVQGPLPGFRPSRSPVEGAYQRVVQAWRSVTCFWREPAYGGGSGDEVLDGVECKDEMQMEGQFEKHGQQQQGQQGHHDERSHEQQYQGSEHGDAENREKVKVEQESCWSDVYALRLGQQQQSQQGHHAEHLHEQQDRGSGYADAGDRKRVKIEERSDWSNDYPLRPKIQEPR